VIILTARADEGSRLEGLANRADAYLTKPFQNIVLELTIQNLLRDRHTVMRNVAMQVWRESIPRQRKSAKHQFTFTGRFMQALGDLYQEPGTDIDALASVMAVSRRQLERKTKIHFGQTPNVLLTEFRLQRAASFLRDETRVIDVAILCGFRNQSHFGAVFKKRFGCTPSSYTRGQAKNG